MSIRLKDTIYDLINNSDKLDGKDSSAFSLTSHTHNFNQITDAPNINLDSGTVTRRVLIQNTKNSNGYISRATLGLTNPASQFSPVFIGVGTNDAGTSFTDYYFSVSGSISDSKGNTYLSSANYTTYAATKDHTHSGYAASSHTHSYLPLSGGTITGTLQIKRDTAAVQYLNASGTIQGWLGFRTADTPTMWKADGSTKYDLLHTGNWSTYCAAASHTHNYAGSSSAGGAATSANKLNFSTVSITSTTNDTVAKWGPLGTTLYFYTTDGQLNNQPQQYGFIFNIAASSSEVHQLWFGQPSSDLYHRGGNSAGWSGSWKRILDSSNYSTYCAAASHTHSYASKVTVGSTAYNVSSNNITIPAYPTSLKCPNSLTIQGNGTSLGSYDGSSAKTINITYSNVGAAAASHTHSYAATDHTHNYAGSSSAGGNANYLASHDTRSVTIAPNAFSAHFGCHFKQNNTNGVNDGGSYFGLIYFKPYGSSTDFSGGYPHELAFTENSNIWYRKATSSTAWGSWQKILTSSNWSTYCAAKSHTHDYAETSHTHGTYHSSFVVTLANTTTDSGWSMINSSYNAGFLLKSIRTSASAPAWIEGNYAAGICFGGADTKGVVSCAYSAPYIKFAGGNGTKPVWWIRVSGTSGTTYNFNSMPYATSAGNADTVDSHHFSTVSALPSSPNANTVYFIV